MCNINKWYFKQQKKEVLDNIQEPSNQSKKKENESLILNLGLLLFLVISWILFYDIWLLVKELYTMILNLVINKTHVITKSNLLNLFNVITSLLVMGLIFLPEIINKSFKNPLTTFSVNLVEKIFKIFKNGFYNIVANKDNFIKIIFYLMILIISVIMYHYTIQKIFLNSPNMLKTISYLGMIIVTITFTWFMTTKINIKNNIDISKDKKELSKFIYLIILYSLGWIIILLLWEYASKIIYDYLINIWFINKIFI